MLQYLRYVKSKPSKLNNVGMRYYRTRADLIVSQDVGSTDCTRASIATILNHAKKQKISTIPKVNDYLLKQCELYRSRGIDGLQPAMEMKAAMELFIKYGLFTQKLNYRAEMLLCENTVTSLVPALKGGMILATCQPPGNSENISHSVVVTDVILDPITKQLIYHVFDPYPRMDRDIYGIRQMSLHDVAKEKLTADIFVSSL